MQPEPEKTPVDLLNSAENYESRSGTKYVIKNVPKVYLSDDCFTPNTRPRITQVTFGKQLSRLDGRDYFDPRDADTRIPPPVLDQWTLRNRELWLPRPGENDVFLHHIAAKYCTKDNYDPRYMPKNQLFPRPYYLELDSLQKLREQGVEKCKDRKKVRCDKMEEEPEIENTSIAPPFWWKEENASPDIYICHDVDSKEAEAASRKRWKPKADIRGDPSRNWCSRRVLMNRVGQPFKHEACLFYYEHHPSPTCELTKIKFSK